MIFPSNIFLLFFLPVVLCLWYGFSSLRIRLICIVIASYIFYAWWDYRFTALMLGSTLLDYYCGDKIHSTSEIKKRKFWLSLSLGGNLGALGFFKYYDFFSSSLVNSLGMLGINASLPLLNLILPLGISFYTFQSMSYSIDIYRGDCKPTSDFFLFAAYVSMFPQLVAGPIVRYHEIEQQLLSFPTHKTDYDQLTDGVWLFMIGLCKKIWIADLLAPMAEYTFDHSISPQFFTAWAGTLCYTLQIYFDFSGYSDMAIGLGKMLGFEFPVNFNSPYKSRNISEFWRRWHITLSNWLRDYLFIPMGGSRYGTRKTLRNLGLTMFLGGLWHGAAWTFVVWGIYHGVLLIIHAIWKKLVRGFSVPHIVAVSITFLSVVIGWVIFRANSINSGMEIIKGMVGLNGFEHYLYRTINLSVLVSFKIAIPQIGTSMRPVVMLVPVLAIVFFARNSNELAKPKHPIYAASLMIFLFYTISTFIKTPPFLYFTF